MKLAKRRSLETFAAAFLSSASASASTAGVGVEDDLRTLPVRPQLPQQENVLCQLPDCEYRNGTYSDSRGDARYWHTYTPAGTKACPATGCPLSYTLDGTAEPHFVVHRHQTWMMEMVSRGYVAATVEYDQRATQYGFCYGIGDDALGTLLEYGVDQKAREVFDWRDEDSVQWQLCDGPERVADCSLGVAVSGFSQGSQIALLGSNYDKRISAALLWATGDAVTYLQDFVDVDSVLAEMAMPCMDSAQLPSLRRRYISGDSDKYFGRNATGTIDQIQQMSHNYYDCGTSHDCLAIGDPETTLDPYAGGLIPNEGGYAIVEGSNHGAFLEWDNYTAAENVEVYAGVSSFDWLARTARSTYVAPEGLDDTFAMDLHLVHKRRVWNVTSRVGVHVEWADENGVVGQRYRLGDEPELPEGGAISEGAVEVTARHSFGSGDVPIDTVGFRVSAVTDEGVFLDRISVVVVESEMESRPETPYLNMTFDADGNSQGGWCLSIDSDTAFPLQTCHGDETIRCVDFCTDGTWHVCDDAIESVSKCKVEIMTGAPTGAPTTSPTVSPTASPTASPIKKATEPNGEGRTRKSGVVTMCTMVVAAYVLFMNGSSS